MALMQNSRPHFLIAYLLGGAGRAAVSLQGDWVGAHGRRALHGRLGDHAREAGAAGRAVAPGGAAGPPRAGLGVGAGLAHLVARGVRASLLHVVASLGRGEERHDDYEAHFLAVNIQRDPSRQ